MFEIFLLNLLALVIIFIVASWIANWDGDVGWGPASLVGAFAVSIGIVVSICAWIVYVLVHFLGKVW